MRFTLKYLILVLFLSSCNTDINNHLLNVNNEEKIQNYISIAAYKPFNLDLQKSSDSSLCHKALSQIYEGLFWVNSETNKVEPLLIEHYSVDGSGTLYTFKLKKNVFFHNDPCFKNGIGRQVFSEDVVYCLNKLYAYDSVSISTKLVTEFTDSVGNMKTKDSLSIAIDSLEKDSQKNILKELNKNLKYTTKIIEAKVITNYQFSVRIAKKDSNFIRQLSEPQYYIYPKEMNTFYSNTKIPKLIGTGPFFIHHSSAKEVVLLKNNKYHGKTAEINIPKIEAIRFMYVPNILDTKALFDNGSIDAYIRKEKNEVRLVLQSDLKYFTLQDYKNNNYKNVELLRIDGLMPKKE